MDFDLVELCRQAIAVAEETLGSKRPATCRLGPSLALAAVPTPELASGHQRHDLGLTGVEVVRGLLGHAALYSVSHTRAVSIVVGALDGRFGIDVERLTPPRPRIAQRILSTREHAALGPGLGWLDVLRCFCVKEATYKVLDQADQVALRFRGLQLEEVNASCTRVCRTDDGRCVAVGAATRGADVLMAIAQPSASRR